MHDLRLLHAIEGLNLSLEVKFSENDAKKHDKS